VNKDYQEPRQRAHGDFSVPCLISSRWLEFSGMCDYRIGAGEVIGVAVMTEGADGNPRKLCELMVTREDLLSVLDLIESPSE